MIERLNLYDLLSALIPGSLLVCAGAVLFPGLTKPSPGVQMPGEFVVVGLLAASMLAGQLIQALGSTLEPLLFLLFGGQPSDRALSGTLGSRYLPRDASERIAAKLRARIGRDASGRSVFLSAMNIAESSRDSKAALFNAQYGYQRSVVVLLLATVALLGLSRRWGAAAGWGCGHFAVAVALSLGATGLFSWRAWQRGAYYAREVLLAAERELDGRSSE